MQQWARDWVKYFTGGQGTYAICGMEDTGTLQSLTFLANAHKVDLNRVLVLRTASNYDVPRNGLTATESIAETKIGHYSAYLPVARHGLPRRPRRRRLDRRPLGPRTAIICRKRDRPPWGGGLTGLVSVSYGKYYA